VIASKSLNGPAKNQSRRGFLAHARQKSPDLLNLGLRQGDFMVEEPNFPRAPIRDFIL
jgi:hypothetical protein